MDESIIPKPIHLEQMITAAETLAEDFSFIRIDFYEGAERPIFGEMTFYPGSGFERFSPEEYDAIIGNFWH